MTHRIRAFEDPNDESPRWRRPTRDARDHRKPSVEIDVHKEEQIALIREIVQRGSPLFFAME